jgi:hypothetical protein
MIITIEPQRRWSTRTVFACLLWLLPALPVYGEPRETLLSQGEPFLAELDGIAADMQISLQADGRRRTVPAPEFVAWGHCSELPSRPFVVMADGGVLVADVRSAQQGSLSAESFLFSATDGPPSFPLEQIAGVVFQTSDRDARDRLVNRILEDRGASDRVILANGDELTGSIRELGEAIITFEADAGKLDLEIHRVRALIFNPHLRNRHERRDLHFVAGFADGSRLIADRLIVDENSVQITVAGELMWTTSRDNLVCLESRGGRFVYLSDLPVAGYRHIPYLDLAWLYRLDRNVQGGMFRAGGHLYLKGIGMHSASRISYALTEPFQHFQVELAIDDHTRGQGSVRFRVYADGKEKYSSPIIRGGQPPLPISVDVTGAKRLDLLVDFADRADEMDRANWLRARLVR